MNKKEADTCHLAVFLLYRCRDRLVPGGANEYGCVQLHQPPPANGDEGAGPRSHRAHTYVGRGPSAATATGFYSVHVQEQTELVQKALQRDPINYLF